MFVDPRQARYAELQEVVGPALFIPLDRPEDRMIVGCGPDPYAVFLGGKWRGECIALRRAENWEGMAIVGVGVEVDWSTAFRPDSNGKKSLTVIGRGDSLGVMADLKERHGYPQRITVTLDDEERSAEGTRLGFHRWRIVIGQGTEKITLVEIEPS